MRPDHLMDQARHLARRSSKKPRQADLRRAVSAAYYAVFHALCRTCADMTVGVGHLRSHPTWAHVYRSVQHGEAKTRCSNVAPLAKLLEPAPLDRGIRRFAGAFANLQEQRHRADYGPHASFTRSEVLTLVASADEVIGGLEPGQQRGEARLRVSHALQAESLTALFASGLERSSPGLTPPSRPRPPPAPARLPSAPDPGAGGRRAPAPSWPRPRAPRGCPRRGRGGPWS